MVYLTLLFALHCRPEGVPSQVLWPSAPAETEPPENQKSISRTAFSLWYRRARLPRPHLLFPSSGPRSRFGLHSKFQSPLCIHSRVPPQHGSPRSEEHTSELQSRGHLVC